MKRLALLIGVAIADLILVLIGVWVLWLAVEAFIAWVTLP
jgi:hypothetical protein